MERNDTAQTGKSFSPRCEERPDCGSTKVESECLCSGIVMMMIMMVRTTMMMIDEDDCGDL